MMLLMMMMMNVTPHAKLNDDLNDDLNVVVDDDDSHVSCKIPLVLRKP